MSQPDSVEPQQAFDELARITLADHDLNAVMEKVVALTKRTVPGASEVSVTLVERGRPSTAAYTGELALHMDERQYDRGYGPCLASIDGGEPLLVSDMSTETRWPDWAQEASSRGVGSSVSIPVPLQREISAALNVYSTEADAFDDAAIELAQTFAAYAGVALANMHLYTAQGEVAKQLQAAMETRAVIEQAKGVLMAQQKCNADEAFDLLIRVSQRENRKLRTIAQDIVDKATGH